MALERCPEVHRLEAVISVPVLNRNQSEIAAATAERAGSSQGINANTQRLR
jgi:hypothetical protein